MTHFRDSARQWILSFLVFDLAFWLFVLGSCLFAFDLCFVGGMFAVAGFYPVFWLPLPDLGVIGGMGANTLLVPVIGIAMHVLMGLGTGWLFRNRPTKKALSIFIAGLILFAYVTLSFIHLQALGFIM